VEEYKSLSKFYKDKRKNNNNHKHSFICRTLTKILVCLIIFVTLLISIKVNPKIKDKVYNIVYENNISFSYINNIYKKYFGNILPFENLFPTDTAVFNEKLVYNEANLYKDGALLKVTNNYLVPTLESGIVVFIGDKEHYGHTIIIQQINGIDVWYGNINTNDIKMYDYVEKGSLLGEVTDNKLYLVFEKEGEYLDYKDYL